MTPSLIGIAGGTASGKTTIAGGLVQHLGPRRCLRITHDRYYLEPPDHRPATLAAWNFDHPDSLDTQLLTEHLALLRAGQEVDLPVYDFSAHARQQRTDRVGPRPFIVVEGILLLVDPGLRSLLDHTVFVHTPEDIRLRRRIDRDVQERGRDEAGVRAQYARTVQPMHEAWVVPSRAHATTVLDGTRPADESVGALLALIGA